MTKPEIIGKTIRRYATGRSIKELEESIAQNEKDGFFSEGNPVFGYQAAYIQENTTLPLYPVWVQVCLKEIFDDPN